MAMEKVWREINARLEAIEAELKALRQGLNVLNVPAAKEPAKEPAKQPHAPKK